MTEGWGFPQRSRKAHYFVNGRSLCGKWTFFGKVAEGDPGFFESKCCAKCFREFDKRKEAKT